ncbi:ribosome recycling factor (RRF) [Reticulomyxa filosa]|uniref:Ribosome recycling factor (RRF) n=1 Tax=Reticulomyxa filosa TaxID=46433 RepID=X6MCH3_RETFI|nr:ribosome recycling factor (RRF) [Reticulomyxa filosa]|eukprot:ETO11147.1 ribosome recycling factor (RRF) [Reticulomyxa filosa]
MDSEEVKKKMEKHIMKLKSQLVTITIPAVQNAVIEKVPVPLNDAKRHVLLNTVATVSMKNKELIVVTPTKQAMGPNIVIGLKIYNADFSPRIDRESGNVFVNIPKPSKETLQLLREKVKSKVDYALSDIKNEHKKALTHLSDIQDFISKNDAFQFKQHLNELVKEQCKLANEMSETKLKEFS